MEEGYNISEEGNQQVNEAMEAYSIAPQSRVLNFLGIYGNAAGQANNNQAFLGIIRGGLPRHSLDSLMEKTEMSIYEMADILNTTDRTLRRYDADVKLNREQSERLIELAQLYTQGEQVFGSAASFKQWMNSEVPALGNKKPKSYLDTSLGINMLLDELTRIEYGVFA